MRCGEVRELMVKGNQIFFDEKKGKLVISVERKEKLLKNEVKYL